MEDLASDTALDGERRRWGREGYDGWETLAFVPELRDIVEFMLIAEVILSSEIIRRVRKSKKLANQLPTFSLAGSESQISFTSTSCIGFNPSCLFY